MIVGIMQGQRKGKGITGVGIILWLMAWGGYAPEDVCGNQTIKIDGYTKFDNEEILELLFVMVEKHVRGKVIYIAEADRALPPRLWYQKKQTHAVIGLQQDEKMGNWVVYDSHLRGVDVMLEAATQVLVLPKYIPSMDMVKCRLVKLQDYLPPIPTHITNVSTKIFPFYETHEPVD